MRDEELIARLLEDDPGAIDRLRSWIRSAFHAYRGRLESELEDLEQDILIEVRQALREDRFEGRSLLRTWVTTWVHHKCIDCLRSRQRRTWVRVDDLDLPAAAPSPLERMAQKERIALARRVLDEMPESCRELWEMLRQGLHYREMSGRLGVSEVTLRSRVLRCRRRAQEAREQWLKKNATNPGPRRPIS